MPETDYLLQALFLFDLFFNNIRSSFSQRGQNRYRNRHYWFEPRISGL